jgi:hypothetical protein
VLDPDERDSVATQFDVAIEQVERDHVISHLLAFLSRDFGDRIHFIGGTALARTHLPDGRLSEDIDLIAVGSRKDVASDLDAALPAHSSTLGRLTIESALPATVNTRPVLLRPAYSPLLRDDEGVAQDASCRYQMSSRKLVSGSWMWMEVTVPHFGRTAERLRLTTGRVRPWAQVRAATSRANAAMMTATRT